MFRLFISTCDIRSSALKGLRLSSSVQNRLMGTYHKSKYSKIEENDILHVLNTGDEKCLSAYAVSPGRLKTFLDYRTKNGRFTTVLEMLEIEGFGEKLVGKFCDSILQNDIDKTKVPEPNNKNESSSRIKGQVLSPSLSPKKLEELHTVSAFHISNSTVSWVQINRDDNALIDWQIIDTLDQNGKRLQLLQILELTWSICSKVPQSNVYVLESQPTALRIGGSDPNNPKLINVNLQKAQLIAMLIALLNAKNSQLNRTKADGSNENELNQCVYLLRHPLAARLFRVVVGKEIVLAHNCVEKIFGIMKNDPEDYKSVININADLQRFYKLQMNTEKEMLGRALLIGLTFMDVCVHKKEEAIKTLAKYRSYN